MDLIRICRTDELLPGEMLRFEAPDQPILVCNVDGEFFATQDTCSHGEWSLSEGDLEDGVVECALHWAKFCVRTGSVKALPARDPLRTYAVKLEGKDVLVDLDSAAVAR